MTLQEERNEARERNKKNKLFLKGLQSFLGESWELTYKPQKNKIGLTYHRHINVRIETEIDGINIYCHLYFPDFRLEPFNVNNFDIYIKRFNNVENAGIRKLFYEHFSKYKAIVNLHDNLETGLTKKEEKKKAIKV
jgi:hypothetical protein